MNKPTLPELPKPAESLKDSFGTPYSVFNCQQMRDYALAALSDRAVLAGKQYETDSGHQAQRSDYPPAATAGLSALALMEPKP